MATATDARSRAEAQAESFKTTALALAAEIRAEGVEPGDLSSTIETYEKTVASRTAELEMALDGQ